MSPSLPNSAISSNRSSFKRSYRKQETSEIIEKLNSQLQHLSEHILNQEPYLLSVPTDVPYRHSSRAINNWRQATPFTEREEYLQYMSFLPHQDDEEELLYVEGGWSDYRGAIHQDEYSPHVSYSTARNTPSSQQRKKISLKDYKTKDKLSDEIMSESQQANGDDGAVLPSSTAPGPTGDRHERDHPDKTKDQAIDPVQKPFAGLDGTSTVSSPVKESDNLDSEQPRKRQRTVSPEIEITDEAISASIDAVAKRKGQLPGLLSPSLPSPEKEKKLPELVSPTLPPSIAAFLSTPPSATLEASTSHHRTDSVRSILASAGMETSNHVRSDSQHSARSNLSTNAARLSPGIKNGARTPVRPGTPTGNGQRSSPGPRQRHIIALKYGKKNRKRVEALMKLPPRTKKVEARARFDTRNPEVSDRHPKAVERPSPVKQRLERTPEIAVKRHRPLPAPLNGTEKPSTPSNHSTKHSQSSNSGASKMPLSSPEKSTKSVAMARVISSDGLEARTPTADRARLSTPLSIEQTTKLSPQPTSTPINRDEERSVWQSMADKYFALGRTIKREASAMSQESDTFTTDPRLPGILFVEALLCFMINLCAESYKHSTQDPGWQTIIPYHIFVFRTSRRFSHLHGLVTQLGAVCRQYIHRFDLDKLAKEPLPDDQLGSAPTPGSDGNTKTVEDAEKHKKKYLDFRDRLVQNSRELETAWLSGSRELSLDTVERDYPKTWAKRARDSSRRSVGRPNPTAVPRDFFLPLDANATAFEAMRFALAFLEEWADGEGVEWKTRIEL